MHRPGFKLQTAAATAVVADDDSLRQAFAQIRRELELPEAFPDEVLAEAERAAAGFDRPEADRTDLGFVTLDPKGSTDLDQALYITGGGDAGYTVHYAIADVPAFITAGGALDAEARRRGQTLYAPDGRIPLHPPRLSEDAASLLPGQERPAFVWSMRLDTGGELVETKLERAMVRSTAQLDYDAVQGELDGGAGHEQMRLLTEVGELRVAKERERGGASLAIPDQEVIALPDGGGYELRMRPPHAVEDHNAQISLMTGIAAAQIMLDGGIGILRTMPPADERHVQRLRRQAHALGAEWPDGQRYGEFLRSLDPEQPRQLALLYEAAALFRGAGYTPFDGTAPPEDERTQAAIGAPYAHTTAPLRRLVDRFVLVCCEALANGREVPGWVREALPELPKIMQESDRRAGALERACVDAVEASLLARRIGEKFTATVVDTDDKRGGALVQITEPPVLAHCDGDGLEPGSEIDVRLAEADVTRRVVRFERA